MEPSTSKKLSFRERIEFLRSTKIKQTQEKWKIIGSIDFDDHAIILPPVEEREVVHVINGSGVATTDVIFKSFKITPNHTSGSFFGPKACGENYGALLKFHPTYIDPISSLAGGYMVNFMSYRQPFWHPDIDFPHIKEDLKKYKISHAIGAVQHFCQDYSIGFELGWGGILKKIKDSRAINTTKEANDFYHGLEAIVSGIQNWIHRHAEAARKIAANEKNPQLRQNLLEISDLNERLVTDPPKTFREACQWMLWFQMNARMYNGSGSLGKLDLLLTPFYEKDISEGILTDEEAVFHIACLLLRDTFYCQLGGPDENEKDVTNRVSFLVLEAAHLLRIPANIGISVGKDVDPELLKRGVEIMFEDKTGIPKFLGVDNTITGFAKNGYPLELALRRAYSGCHWSSLPGREYTINDCVKINIAVVFEIALRDMMSDKSIKPSIKELWNRFENHLQHAIFVTAKSHDFNIEHMHEVFPELVMDLLCHGPIEKGLDASHGGVEFYNLCIDGAGLATIADSFAALDQRIEKEGRLTWEKIMQYLDTNWAGQDGEKARLMMKNINRFGHGASLADEYAIKVSESFTKFMKEKPTPAGYNMIPGLFSWAQTIEFGKDVSATPNGRYKGAPISHGPNPDPGFRRDGAPTAMAVAVASVQSGYGNACPMQMELEPGITKDEGGVEKVANLIKTHFDLGGTQINLNILNKEKILEAHKDPMKYPDLVVRVTGFSAFFSSLSPEFRQIVVDRILSEK